MKIPKTTSVDSSIISEIGYDNELRNLFITFKRNITYVYFNVPENTYMRLLNSDSVGSYFSSFIKGQFEYKKV